MLYQSTSVGFGYGLWRRRCFPEVLRRPPNPVRENDFRPSSRSAGGGILTPFPSAAAFALALGARLTLRGMTLRRNPWTFGVRGSHPHLRYSCQHSHFRCLHSRSRACFAGLRNAPLPRQKTGIRNQGSELPRESPCSMRAISRYSPCQCSATSVLDIAKITSIQGSILASRRPTRSPSSQSDGTRCATDAACQTLRRCWRRSISTPAAPGRPAQTARSVEIRGSPDAPPATADKPAETPRDPRPAARFSLISNF